MKGLLAVIAALVALISVAPQTAKAEYLEYAFPAASFTTESGAAQSEGEYAAQTAAITALLSRAEELFNPALATSDVARVNAAAAGESVAVDPLTFRLFQAAQSAYFATEGAFNPALYPLTKLWGFSSDNAANYRTPRPAPSAEQIAALLSYTDFSAVTLNAQTHTVTKPQTEMMLDFGGIAKGFLLDEITAAFPSGANALLSIMSSIALLGSKYDGASFRPYAIAVTDPRKAENVALVLSAKNAYLSTSGDYERYYIYKNKRYSHVLNAQTGAPAAFGVMSATAVASSGALSDALSTALCTLPLRKGKALCEKLGASAAVICENYEYYLFGGLTAEKSSEVSSAYTCPYRIGTDLPETVVPYRPQKSYGKQIAVAAVVLLGVALVLVTFYKRKSL